MAEYVKIQGNRVINIEEGCITNTNHEQQQAVYLCSCRNLACFIAVQPYEGGSLSCREWSHLRGDTYDIWLEVAHYVGIARACMGIM